MQKLSDRIQALENQAAHSDVIEQVLDAVRGPSVGAASAPCKFFAKGCCAKGDACSFSHEPLAWSEASGVSANGTTHVPESPEQNRFVAGTVLTVGSHVVLTGLASVVELNGESGRVTSFDEVSCRFGVRLADGRQKSVKRDNLLLKQFSD